MTNLKPKRPPPLSLRLSEEERERLESQAAGMSLSAYIRACIFGGKRKKNGKFAAQDHKALARILAYLGQSSLSNNLDTLAQEAGSGSLPLTPETESALRSACREITAIKKMLMAALGIQER